MTYDPKTKTWEWRQGYDYATEKHKFEIDRLRAENAELRRCIGSARTAVAGRDYRNALAELEDAIEELAKTAKEGE